MDAQQAYRGVKKVLQQASKIILPPRCLGCSKEVAEVYEGLCERCYTYVRSTRLMPLDVTYWGVWCRVYALGRYDGPLRRLLCLKNYRDDLGAHIIGSLIGDMYADVLSGVDIIIPVPLHWSRTLWRGFNQSMVIAHQIQAHSSVSLMSCVERIRRTPQLTSFAQDERNSLLYGTFTLSSNFDYSACKGKVIAIVDDVYTSGSTVREMCRVIRSLDPLEVIVLVGARAL